MFSGIIEKIGTVVQKKKKRSGVRLWVQTEPWPDQLDLGESISTSGVCLTVVEVNDDVFSVDVVPETLRDTTIQHWKVGTQVNLERSLRAMDRLGGHLVSGHVDGVGKIKRKIKRGGSCRLAVGIPPSIIRYFVPKGSIAIDGISLTIQKLNSDSVEVAIIPETVRATTIGSKKVGDFVNLEIDMMAKEVYHFVEKLQRKNREKHLPQSS